MNVVLDFLNVAHNDRVTAFFKWVMGGRGRALKYGKFLRLFVNEGEGEDVRYSYRKLMESSGYGRDKLYTYVRIGKWLGILSSRWGSDGESRYGMISIVKGERGRNLLYFLLLVLSLMSRGGEKRISRTEDLIGDGSGSIDGGNKN